MELSREEKSRLSKKLLVARLNLLAEHGFYGLLLMRTSLGLSNSCSTAYTDSKGIFFSPKFLSKLSLEDTEVILLHEILHIVLRHCFRGNDYDDKLFNIACDIVVNSNIKKSLGNKKEAITILKGTKEQEELMHIAPDGKEGYIYTAEEVYEMLVKKEKKGKAGSAGSSSSISKSSKSGSSSSSFSADGTIDSHEYWPKNNDSQEDAKNAEKEWIVAIAKAADSYQKQLDNLNKIRAANKISKLPGDLPSDVVRLLKSLKNPTVDWRSALQDFLHEEVFDYTFLPPDNRYQGSEFFLPSFSDTEQQISNIVFLIDASGSVDDDFLTEFLSEIRGFQEQFRSKAECYIGIFDVRLTFFEKIEDIKDIQDIRFEGGGGTDLYEPLKEVFEMIGDDINCFVVLTDGYMYFPAEKDFHHLPVLWLINNDEMTPPYGRVARLVEEE